MRRTYLSSIYILLILLSIGHADMAFAQAKTLTPTTGLLQIFLALIAVIGVMLIAAWLLKRMGPISANNRVPMKMLGGLNIGTRERIIVVEVADQWLVLGVTSNQINTLSTMDKQALPEIEQNSPLGHTPFAIWLKKTIEKRNAVQEKSDSN
ncbi:MAG: flagellar biosynthetic protein FliO [Undibacterium sp.]|nr:flagellar biosynthetic protein FliO [Undibacterium sp.]